MELSVGLSPLQCQSKPTPNVSRSLPQCQSERSRRLMGEVSTPLNLTKPPLNLTRLLNLTRSVTKRNAQPLSCLHEVR
jgi:hypothetical protein